MVELKKEKQDLLEKLKSIRDSIESGGFFWGYKLSMVSIRYKIMLIDLELNK